MESKIYFKSKCSLVRIKLLQTRNSFSKFKEYLKTYNEGCFLNFLILLFYCNVHV